MTNCVPVGARRRTGRYSRPRDAVVREAAFVVASPAAERQGR